MATKRISKKAEVVAEVPAFVPVGIGSFEAVVKATQAGSFCYTSADVHTPLIEKGFVEINPAMVDEAGSVATRATEAGIAALQPVAEESEPVQTQTQTQTPAVAETFEEKPMPEITQTPFVTTRGVFKIEDDVAIPDSRQGGRQGESYPFGLLNVGQSFFVPADEKRPHPVKDFASTVSSATARYAVPHPDGTTRVNRKGATVPLMVETRKFIIRAVEGGARVWRTA